MGRGSENNLEQGSENRFDQGSGNNDLFPNQGSMRQFRFKRHQEVRTPFGTGKIIQRIWGIDYPRYRVEFDSPDIRGFYDETFFEDELREIRKR